MEFTVLLEGLAGGIVYGISGYAKNRRKQNFNWKKIGRTALISGVIGLVAAYQGVDLGTFANSTTAMAITVLGQKIWTTIINEKEYKPKIKKKAVKSKRKKKKR